MLAISVTDTGIGISESQQKIIFEAFQQADGSTSRKYGGTGLGLSISKELMRLLKGEIELHSAEGEGSTFTIVLPYQYTATYSKHPDITESPFVLPPVTEIIPQKDVLDNRDDIHPGDKVMLIIEDDIVFAGIVSDFAQQKGYKVVVATQGDEGLKYARQYIPAAIILDVQLPVIDGWSLLNLFKNDDQLKHIPVHIISAFDNDKSIYNGAFAYLKKPVDKQALEDAFTTLGLHLQEQMKKILILSVNHFMDDKLQNLFHEKHRDAQFNHVQSVDEAIQLLKTNEYDCLITDIGNQVTEGINSLEKIRKETSFKNTPIIIYLDTDISSADELQLKKFSDVIVRSSSAADNRLTDELELFLYNVQEVKPKFSLTDTTQIKDTRDISLVNKKVLLVDDDMRNVFALTTALETQQMNIITASDGKESLEMLQQHPDIDLVLMDIMMPEMDGYEAIRHIRQDMKLTRLPIIALTAKAMTGDRETCI
jgi:CheY-like chemotaxis protein